MTTPLPVEDFESLDQCSVEKLYKLAHKAHDYHLSVLRDERQARTRMNNINKELIKRGASPLNVGGI